MSFSVTLVKPWFGPGGVRYRAGYHTGLPDELRSQLPSSAKVEEVVVEVEDEPEAKADKLTPPKTK